MSDDAFKSYDPALKLAYGLLSDHVKAGGVPAEQLAPTLKALFAVIKETEKATDPS